MPERDQERDEARDDGRERSDDGRAAADEGTPDEPVPPDFDDLTSEPDFLHGVEPEIVSSGYTVQDDAATLAIGNVPGEDPHGDYGTGGGDVGIGGDVSPYGAMNDLDAPPEEVEAERVHDNPDYAKQGDSRERSEDLGIASSDLRQQGEDEAWPADDEDLPSDLPYGGPGSVPEVDPLAAYDDEDSPMMEIVDEDELDEGAA